MTIISKTPNLTPAELYAMTKGNDVRKMADAKGETLEVSKYVLYEDVDVNGEPMKVLAIETASGVRYATNSKTFTRNFSDILEMFESSGVVPPTKYYVGSGKSKAGREYITCEIAEA